MKNRLLGSFKVGTLMVVTILSFQNCAKNDSVAFSELTQETSAASQEPETQANPASSETSNTAPTNAPQTIQCFPSGYVFTTGDALPFIHYRKCDGEIELWRSMGNYRCCSGQVSIEDVERYEVDGCPRFRGVMTCL
ncbi:MAG: hypothetical protein HUU57_03180 [Bdellovibrio sp.]|nr:hypothetical protein [Bdellovibrio sp.]